jgi:hypothetical protein
LAIWKKIRNMECLPLLPVINIYIYITLKWWNVTTSPDLIWCCLYKHYCKILKLHDAITIFWEIEREICFSGLYFGHFLKNIFIHLKTSFESDMTPIIWWQPVNLLPKVYFSISHFPYFDNMSVVWNYLYLFVTELLVPFCHRITGAFLSQNYLYLFVTEVLVPFCHRITGIFLSQNYNWYLFVTDLELLVPFCHRMTGTVNLLPKVYFSISHFPYFNNMSVVCAVNIEWLCYKGTSHSVTKRYQ